MPRKYRRGNESLSYDLRVRISAATAEALEAAAAATFQTRAQLARTILENFLISFQPSRKEKVTMIKDYQASAAALYNGGWKSSDYDELKDEYNLTDEETTKICEILQQYETENTEE